MARRNVMGRCSIRLFLVAGATLGGALANAQPIKRLDAKVQGGIRITGNTLGLSKQADANGPGTLDGIGTFTSVDVNQVDASPANPGNPWFPGTTSDFHANSSAARLDLPAAASVLYAELVWGGSYQYGAADVSAALDQPIQLGSESGASLAVTPDPQTAVTLSQMAASGALANYYVRTANVTAFVAQEGAGLYTVSGVPATQTEPVNTSQAAGWSLIVAYADPGAPFRSLQIFVDGRLVDELVGADTPVAGLDVPSSNLGDGRLFLAALEGDANRQGDGVTISPNGGQSFVPVSGTNNPVTNFFASQINDSQGALDTSGTFGNRNHDAATGVQGFGARQGWDITGVALSQQAGQIENDETSAVVRVSTTGDELVLAAVALEIPSNPVDAVCGNGVVESGELCDDGNDINGDGCENDCTLTPPPAVCGDGVVDPGEECDAGANNGFPACLCELDCRLPTAETACGSLAQCESDLNQCLSRPDIPDADGDGEADPTDACPGTPPGSDVDQAGCSLAQFCAAIPVATLRDRLICRFSDWRNDRPLSLVPRDCAPTPNACAPMQQP